MVVKGTQWLLWNCRERCKDDAKVHLQESNYLRGFARAYHSRPETQTETAAMYQEAKQTCVLNMHFEDLYAVPRQVLNLVRLKELRIVGNPKLEMIPPALSKLVHLRVLKLCANALGALFEDWCPFTQLQIVDLSSNKLRWIPDSLVQLEHLEELHMSGNALEYLPEDLSMMKSLRILRMQSNALQYLRKV